LSTESKDQKASSTGSYSFTLVGLEQHNHIRTSGTFSATTSASFSASGNYTVTPGEYAPSISQSTSFSRDSLNSVSYSGIYRSDADGGYDGEGETGWSFTASFNGSNSGTTSVH